MTSCTRNSLVLSVLLATLWGCGSGNDAETPTKNENLKQGDADPQAKPKSRVIGFSALTLTNPFFKVIADEMTAAGAKHGFKVIVLSGERDANRQSGQIEQFISDGVDVIVLNPCDSKAVGPAIRKANDAGIPVFTNDLAYAGDLGEVVCHVATDNYQGGKLAGQALVQHLAETGGEVGILHFPQAESCQLRVQGFREVIDAHNEQHPEAQIKIVATLDGGGDLLEGRNAASAMIEAHQNLAVIFAINDPSALGAYRAVEAAGKTQQIKIIGFDGQPEGKEAIRDGEILCDPVQFPDRIAVTTIEQIVKYFDGEDVESEILIPSELYYREDALKDPSLKPAGE